MRSSQCQLNPRAVADEFTCLRAITISPPAAERCDVPADP
jgi:hypothetical protein